MKKITKHEDLNTKFLESARNRDVEKVSKYLEQGADKCAVDANGNTALHLVMENGCQDAAEVLLKAGTDEHIKNNLGKTAIDLADPKLADWFIQKSRSMRLQQLLILEKKVEDLTKKVEDLTKQVQMLQKPEKEKIAEQLPFFTNDSKSYIAKSETNPDLVSTENQEFVKQMN